MASPAQWFLNLFRPKEIVIPPDLDQLSELSPSDYQSRREMYPIIPVSGWDARAVLNMLENHDAGNFQMSELFYHAARKEGLIASALDLRRQYAESFASELKVPKEAPDEVHLLTDHLAKDWQAVMPDQMRGEIIERVNFFGFQVCRIQWIWHGLQKQPRLIPYTHSSLSWRQDLWCYQGISERGLEIIRNDGRAWVIFSLGGTRPWLRGLIRPLAFPYFGVITGDDQWLQYNDLFAAPLKIRYMPRMTRESQEAQKLHEKDNALRGGDVVLCPREAKDTGYDFRYEQIDGTGFETIKEKLLRLDERIAIIILGHNLLQSVKGGSLAAMREAMAILRIKAVADAKILMSGFEQISKIWCRANFGTNAADFPELLGQPLDTFSWSLVYDISDPEAGVARAKEATDFANAFATFAKAAGEKLFELPIDWEAAAVKSGIPMTTGEEGYDQDDTEDTDLAAEEWIEPPAYMKAAARRSLEWVHRFQQGGTEKGRSMARKILRGRLTRVDVLAISRYWPHHEHDKDGKDWDNMQRPSSARISWGLWGDLGDGRGRKWSEERARLIRDALTPTEAAVIYKPLLTLAAIEETANDVHDHE